MRQDTLSPSQKLAAIGHRLQKNGVGFDAEYNGGGEYTLTASDPSTGRTTTCEVGPVFPTTETADRLLRVVRKGQPANAPGVK